MKPLVGPWPKDPAWHEARKNCIGASEAAAACGVGEWEQPLDIYLRKRGEIPEKDENDAMRLGKALEGVIVSEYEHRTQRTLRALPMLFHPEYPFIAATCDRMVIGGDGGFDFPVEAKSTTRDRLDEFGMEGTDDVPIDYLMQCQQQMLVTDTPKCDLAVLIDGRTLRIYNIPRHEAVIQSLIASESELWERIQAGDPPEPDWSHGRTLDLVRKMYRVEATTCSLPSDVAALWDEYEFLGQRIRETEATRRAVQARVLHAMGDSQVARFADRQIELVRSQVSPLVFSQEDVLEIQGKLGLVKRAGYVRLHGRKIKE